MRDVAEAAGVSVCTASNALRGIGRVAESTRETVRLAAARLGYFNDPVVASALSKARRRSSRQEHGAIGVLLSTDRPPTLATPEGSACLSGIELQAAAHGYAIDQLFPDRDYSGSPERLLQVIEARGLCGLIFLENIHSIYLGALTSQLLQERATALPIIFAGRSEVPPAFAWHVGFDRFASGFLCMEHAFQSGYRRSGVLTMVGRRTFPDEFAAGCLKVQQRFLPIHQIPSAFAFDTADPKTVAKMRRWLAKESIDCLVTNVRGKRLFRDETGIPIIHGELSPDHVDDSTGVVVNWETIGRFTVEALFNRLQQPFALSVDEERRLLVPGEWHGALPSRHPHPRKLRKVALARWVNGSVNLPGQWFGRHPLPLHSESALHAARHLFQLDRSRGEKEIGGIFLRSTNFAGGLPSVDRPSYIEIPIPPAKHAVAPTIHLLLGCGHAKPGARFASIRAHDRESNVCAEYPLVSGGRPNPPAAANIQDWWPHYPLLDHAIPVYHPLDRVYHGYLYHLAWKLPAMPHHLTIRANARSPTTLAILGLSIER